MGNKFKIAMFITSFIPLWITVLFIYISSIINNSNNIYTEIIGIIIIFLMNVYSLLVILVSLRSIEKSEYKEYKIINARQEKGITSEFLLSYVLPLFAFDFTRWDGIVQFLIYYIILAFLSIRNNNVYANLIFELKNYKFYDCELIWTPEPDTSSIQTIVISKDNLCSNIGNTIEVASLNKPFYLMKSLEE